MQDNHIYRYFAYMAYSVKDTKAAMKLFDKIGSYRIPDRLRDDLKAATGKECPKRIYQLFLCTNDLPVVLEEKLYSELEDSKFLLLICSPNSAKSEWVNRIVEAFIIMGRYDKIIPYIVEGTPNSGDPETECFPPILRKKREYIAYSHLTPEENAERQAKLHAILDGMGELKGVSLSGEGERYSRLKIIARMLEIPPDMCFSTDKRLRTQNFIRKTITAALFLVLLTCLGLWAWDHFFRVHTSYFADYVEYWSVPKGIFPLSDEQRAHRSEYYRIYTQNRKVIRLEHVNSAGTPIPVENTEFKDRPMIANYFYNDKRLIQKDVLDKNGCVTMSFKYSGDRTQNVNFTSVDSDGVNIATVLTNATSPTYSIRDPSKKGNLSEIGNLLFFRDEEGRLIDERFQKGSLDIPTTDEQGIAGFKFKLDEYGRVVEQSYFDLEASLRPDKYGVARRTNRYDESGNLVEAKYFDQNGELTKNESGWAHSIRMFDKYGNLIEEKFFDASGNLSLSNDMTAGYLCKYDERGNLIEVDYLGVDGQPCLNIKGFAKVIKKYDEQGNEINVDYFDIDGKAVEPH